MSSLNLCQFIGNVGKIESRYLSSGDPVVNLSLACNESYKNKAGEKQEKVEWVNVTIYGKLAEIAEKFVESGKQIYISGKMETRKYTDKQGIERYATNIIAHEMVMLGSKPFAADSDRTKTTKQSGSGFEDFDSNIPF